MAEGTEIKTPGTGDTGWVNMTDRNAGKILAVSVPTG